MIFYPNPNHVVVVPKLHHIRTTRSQHFIENWNSYLWFAVTYNANIYSADLVVTSVTLSWPVLKLSTGIFTISSSCIVTFSGVAALLTGCHDCFLPSSYHTVDTQQTEAPWSSMKRCQLPFDAHVNWSGLFGQRARCTTLLRHLFCFICVLRANLGRKPSDNIIEIVFFYVFVLQSWAVKHTDTYRSF